MIFILVGLAFATVGGLWLALTGLLKRHRRHIVFRPPKINWDTPFIIGFGLTLVGCFVALSTGWVVAIVLFPIVGLGMPYLVGQPTSATTIAKLEAMEEWTRSLSGILTAGAGLEQALVATLRSTPAPIHQEVSRLVARLRARWTTPAALRAFADDLNDPTGDIIAANLLLGAQRRGDGLATILEGLAESVALDIRARRQVEADAAKPRATARWVTLITALVLGALFFTGAYVEPYKTGLGQLILMLMLAAYGAVLVWMRNIATGPVGPRFLGKIGGLA